MRQIFHCCLFEKLSFGGLFTGGIKKFRLRMLLFCIQIAHQPEREKMRQKRTYFYAIEEKICFTTLVTIIVLLTKRKYPIFLWIGLNPPK